MYLSPRLAVTPEVAVCLGPTVDFPGRKERSDLLRAEFTIEDPPLGPQTPVAAARVKGTVRLVEPNTKAVYEVARCRGGGGGRA